MRALVAGGSGVIGRSVVSAVVARGDQVSATTTDSAKLDALQQVGADGRVTDGLDPLSIGEVVAAAEPDVIVNQMTGLSGRHAGKANPRSPTGSSRPRTSCPPRGSTTSPDAATAAGVPRVVTGTPASTGHVRAGGVKTEDDPLEVAEGTKAIAHLERAVGMVKSGERTPWSLSGWPPSKRSGDQLKALRE